MKIKKDVSKAFGVETKEFIRRKKQHIWNTVVLAKNLKGTLKALITSYEI